jgi:rubrerythrin
MNAAKFTEILEMAVKNEEEAFEFYRKASQKVADPGLKKIFTELAQEESGHKSLLLGYVEDSMKTLKFKDSDDYKISETLPLPKMTTDMKFTDAIALAMKKEEQAMNMYKEFAGASDDKAQKETFMELSKMEKGHKTRLEAIYTDTAFVEVW